MAKLKAPQRKQIEVEVDCDRARLYGPLFDAIAYLQEIQAQHSGVDITLDEHWTGYEDMTMRFVYYRPETDEELEFRLEQERCAAEYAAKARQEEAAKAERRKQYERLQREFGR